LIIHRNCRTISGAMTGTKTVATATTTARTAARKKALVKTNATANRMAAQAMPAIRVKRRHAQTDGDDLTVQSSMILHAL